MQIKDRIKELRASKSLTQQEFADELDIKKVLVAHWETGRANPGLENLTTICNKYEITADWLLFGKGSMVPVAESFSIASEPSTAYQSAVKTVEPTDAINGKKDTHKASQPAAYTVQAEMKNFKSEVRLNLENVLQVCENVSLQNQVLLRLLQEIGAASSPVPLDQWVQKTSTIKASVLQSFERRGKS